MASGTSSSIWRYVSRTPVATERLTLTDSGDVRYALKTPFRGGTTHVLFEPEDLIARLAGYPYSVGSMLYSFAEAKMDRLLIGSLCMCLVTGLGWAQDERAGDHFRTQGRLTYESGNRLLSDGSRALRTGDYEEGIRLTLLGLDQGGISTYLRTSALSNLCAAYAAINQPDAAIEYCSESLESDAKNWRALSNRAYAHWLKGMHSNAASDLEAAAAINPGASEIEQIRGLINQSTLLPRVNVEDRQ